jgi:transcriptional regulator with XRE-family HTH domain
MKGVKKESRVTQDPKATLKKIGKKLKKLREAKGYKSSEAFTYDHDISRPQYGKYEAGAQDMRISTLLKTVNLLGVTLEEFFRDGLE